MDSRVFLALLLFSFCVAQVSSDSKTDEETNHLSQAFHVFPRGASRKLMQDIVLRVTKYFISPDPVQVPAPAQAPAPSTGHRIDCGGLCKYRCSEQSRQNLCMRACGTCCARCNCVPPGTSGNKEVCGSCYTDMTTHHNKTKCP